MYKSFELLSSEFYLLTNLKPEIIASANQAKLLAKFRLQGSVDSSRAATLAREILVAISLLGVLEINTSLQKMLQLLTELSSPLLLENYSAVHSELDSHFSSLYEKLSIEKYLPKELLSMLVGSEGGLRVGFASNDSKVWREIANYILKDANYSKTLDSVIELELVNLDFLTNKEHVDKEVGVLLAEILFLLRVLYENVNYSNGNISIDKLLGNLFLLNGYRTDKKHFWNDFGFLLDLVLRRKSKITTTSRSLSITLFSLIVLTQLTDYASTKAGVRTGIPESNALMHYFMDSQGMLKFLLLKLLSGIFLGWYFWGRVLASLVVVLIFTLVTLSNLLVIVHTLEIILI